MFCASEAATAICRSSEQQVISSSTTIIHLGSGRAIDRHNPIIHGSRRSVSSSTSPSPSSGTTSKKPAASTSTVSSHHPKPHQNLKAGRKSTSDHAAAERKSSASLVDAVRNSSCVRPSAYFAPTDSRRHLLSNNLYMDKQQPHSERVLALESKKFTGPKDGGEKPVRCSSLKNDDDVPSSDKYCSPFRISSDQVVVVRVSLHCKGCAGKVKKYISRMQGVTSFNIDLDAKKVIVVGDVTRSEVLASISKVRTAQLLPPERPNDAKQVIII